MRVFRNLPIKWKLMLAMVVTSMVALLLLGTALFFAGLLHLKNLAVQETAALAEIVGGNCAGALERKDARTAQQDLGSIAANPTVEDACLFTAGGQLLARYTRRDLAPLPAPPAGPSGESFAGDRLKLYRPIKHDGRMVGAIYLQADTRIVWARIKNYAGMGILVMGISMLVALIFAHRLQGFFSAPILELVRVAEGVAGRKDFSLRAARLSNDETGQLTDAFNRMLGLIQEHDSGTRASQSRLEKRVVERTAELRKANESLQESEQRLASLIQSAPVAIVIHASDGRVTRTNETARKLLGLSESSAVGKQLSDPAWTFFREDGTVMPPQEFPAAQVLARREMLRNFVFGVQQRQTRDIVWGLANAVPISDSKGGVQEVVVSFMDITERRRAEKELRENHNLLRTIIESSQNPIYVYSLENRFLLVNSIVARSVGMPAEQMIGKHLSEVFTPAEVERLEARNRAVLESGQSQASEDTVLLKGAPRTFLVNKAPLRDHKGQVVGIVGVAHDITERKQAEQALQHRLELEHFVASASSRLANTALAEVDVAIREVLLGLGRHTGTDRCYLFRVSDDLAVADNTHEWCAPGVRPQISEMRNVPTAAFPWYLERLRGGEPLLLPRTANLPAEAAAEKRLAQAGNVQSLILVPIRHAGALVGFIGCDAMRAERAWTGEDARLLRTIGELITDTLARLRASQALSDSQRRLQLALEAGQTGTVELDFASGGLLCDAVARAQRGLPPDGPITWQQYEMTIHPEDRAQRQAALDRALDPAGNGHFTLEYRVLVPRSFAGAAGLPDANKTGFLTVSKLSSGHSGSPDAATMSVGDSPTEHGELPTERGELPTERGEIPTRRVELSTQRGDPPTERGEVPTKHGELPMEHGDAPTERGEPPGLSGIPDKASVIRWIAAVGQVFFKDDRPVRLIGTTRDITEQKQAEEALARSRASLQIALDAAQLGPWHWDIVTGELHWSAECLAVYGLPADTVMTFEGFLRAIHPDDRERVQAALREAVAKRTEYAIEKRVLRPDGLMSWIAARGRCTYDDAGRPLRMDGVSFDITRRKLAEEIQWETLQRLELATRAANAGLWEMDMTTRRGYLSPIWKRQLGYADDEISNRVEEYEERLHPEDHDRVLETDRRFAESPETQLEKEFRLRHKDGSYRWILSRAEMKRDAQGKPLRMLGLHIDITERKQAEEALKTLNETLEQRVAARTAALEQRGKELEEAQRVAHVGNWTWELETGYVTWSEELCRIFGRDPKLPVPSFDEHRQLLTAESMSRLNAAAEQTTRTGTPYQVDLEVIRPDGTRRWIAAHGEVAGRANGRVVSLRGTAQDITDRKRLEGQLLEISEREQRRIGQDLHDGLCQHLAGVGFMSKALAQRLSHAAPAEAADARAVADLIRQAISDARGIAAGLHPVKKEANGVMVALQELAANIGNMFRIQCVFSCDPPVLIEDNDAATHLYRIAQEAANNAIRHGKAKRIWITLAGTEHRVTLTVKDDGKGISQPPPAGHGIGLDIMHHRARVIGSNLDLGRAPEGGTILTCSFPRKPLV
ncbi:MAG: PAS domain S-box protein [Verrucomicrobia bacterium]|nr:PAS domain S-box protein [Verrucomicrobiota bacterium]